MRLLSDMALFVELAKLQNFGRAAAALGMTASTLSRRITSLEKEMGVALVIRSTRSFGLTGSGQDFFERSQKIVAEATRAREEVGANFSTRSGHLRVGLPFDLAATILAPVLAKYCRENAGVSMDILATQEQPDLSTDSLDVAFVVAHQTAMTDSSFRATRVGSFARWAYASRLYLKRNGTPASPQELRDHQCVRHYDGSPKQHWELFQGRRRETVTVKAACGSSSIIVVAQAAREHLGIAMLAQHLASHPAFGAGLVRVLDDWEGAKAMVFAITANCALPARTRALIHVVKADFDKRLAQMEAVS